MLDNFSYAFVVLCWLFKIHLHKKFFKEHIGLKFWTLLSQHTINPLIHNNTLWRLWNIMHMKILWKMEHLLFWATAPFPMIFSKVLKVLLKFFLIFFQCYLKLENYVMIGVKGLSQWQVSIAGSEWAHAYASHRKMSQYNNRSLKFSPYITSIASKPKAHNITT